MQAEQNQYLPYLEDGEEILLKGKLTGKEQKNEQYLYNLSSCQIRQDSKISEWQRISASIIIYGESDTCSIGQTLVLHGKIKLFNRARNEGNFDQAAYYKARGTAFAVSDVDEVSAYGKANLIAEKMYQWKYHLAGLYEQALGVREGGVLSTMLLGENLLDAGGGKTAFTAPPGSHIFWRYSGLHIAASGIDIVPIAAKRELWFLGIGNFCGSVYDLIWHDDRNGIFARSVASVCFALFCLGRRWGEVSGSLNAMVTALLILARDSRLRRHDAGFRLSLLRYLVWYGLEKLCRAHTRGMRCCKNWYRIRASACDTAGYGMVFL
ncbi:MAG: DUF4131 domain-containing protein [Roseburia inulinivorans]